MKSALIILGFCILISLSSCQNQGNRGEKKGEDSFVFSYMTDIHLKLDDEVIGAFSQALDTAIKLNSDFILSGGDLVCDVLRQDYNGADSLYVMYEHLTSKLNIPVYNTIGNHDMFGVFNEGGVNPSHAFYGKKIFEKRLNKCYYSFDHKGWHFIVLDALEITKDRRYRGYIDPIQLNWLKDDLYKIGKETPVVISTHIPFFSISNQVVGTKTKKITRGQLIENAREVLKILTEYNVKLVLQGHRHFLEDINYKGIHFISGGSVSSNSWKEEKWCGLEEGFLKITVTGEEFEWDYIDYGWEAKP